MGFYETKWAKGIHEGVTMSQTMVFYGALMPGWVDSNMFLTTYVIDMLPFEYCRLVKEELLQRSDDSIQ